MDQSEATQTTPERGDDDSNPTPVAQAEPSNPDPFDLDQLISTISGFQDAQSSPFFDTFKALLLEQKAKLDQQGEQAATHAPVPRIPELDGIFNLDYEDDLLQTHDFVGVLPNGDRVYRPKNPTAQEQPTAIEETEEYPFPPLPDLHSGRSIRVLAIYPEDLPGFQGELFCGLGVIHFDDRAIPSFEAISYTWGSPVRSKKVWAAPFESRSEKGGGWTHRHEFSSRHHFKVTESLYKLLHHLRRKDELRVVWIDQLCIDQDNPDEKAEQIKTMAEIYQRASKTHVWLGDGDESSEKAVNCLKRLADMKEYHWESPFERLIVPASKRQPQPWNLATDDPFYLPKDEWDALRQVLAYTPWFRRSWIVQEVVLALSVTISLGNQAIEWNIIEAACHAIDAMRININLFNHYYDPAFAVNNVIQFAALRHACQTGQDPLHLRSERLLMDLRGLEATNARDILYSKYAIFTTQELPKPDYKASVREVYVGLMIWWLTRHGHRSLDILSEAQVRNVAHDLPSWVPDWSIPKTCNPLAAERINRGFDATLQDENRFPPRIQLPNLEEGAWDKSQPILTVRGIRLFMIHILQRATEESSFVCPKQGIYPLTGESYRQVYSLLLYSNSMEPLVTKPSSIRTYWQHREYYHNNPINLTHTENLSLVDFTADLSADSSKEKSQNRSMTLGRNMFISDCGLVGFVPTFTKASVKEAAYTDHNFGGGARPGDFICLLYGSRIPFVLRKVEGGRYRLIGEAFVYGLMHGEVVSMIDEDLFEDYEDFAIE